MKLSNRQSIRLKGYDYSQGGIIFYYDLHAKPQTSIWCNTGRKNDIKRCGFND
ncbi:MAG: hypothetical protein U9O87_03330 [Verrucomicrobiota bacterium]|nr:hypothetical protein [Verrucomicrobiota bacterium]